MVTYLRGKFVTFEYTLKMNIRLEKLNKNCRCVENYFENFCSMAMIVGFV